MGQTKRAMNIILAAGDQRRWLNGNTTKFKVKQLIEIEGQTLIERIQDQFGGVVMTNDKAIIKKSKYHDKPERHRWTIETLRESRAHWAGQTIILLGDVYYTKRAVEKIKAFIGKQMFFGNKDEIFAISFNDHDFMLDKLNRVIYLHEQHEVLKNHGELWTLYRHCNWIEILDHRIDKNFTFIQDDTRDFDVPGDYLNF